MINSLVNRWHVAAFVVACLAFPAAATVAAAQTSTGTIRGFVTEGAAPLADATIGARDVQTNYTRGTRTGADGFYNLAGLRPGTYELSVRRVGVAPQTRQVQVQIGQTIDANFQLSATTTTLASVVVTAAARGTETRTPEVATNITTRQIEDLPQANRNFLAFAQQAPGVRVDRNGNFAGGAQSADNVNVFIDGASYKSDILPGGVVGQDPGNQNPAGNPFPLASIQEFRVITQNYKAEYQKASSAIIVATTKTGGNTWSGSAFGFTQPKKFSSTNFFERQNNQSALPFTRTQSGISLGGPIIRDRLHFFGSYEQNDQDRFNTVRAGSNRAATPDSLLRREGTFTAPFRSHLGFAKLTYEPSDESKHMFELSGNIRDESDVRGFGGQQAQSLAETLNNKVTTGIAKYQYAGSRFLNETQASFQRYQYNPEPSESGVQQVFVDAITIGPKDSRQNLIQDRLALRNDVTSTLHGFGGTHVVKGGASIDFLKYDVDKQLFTNPTFYYFGQFQTPAFAFYGAGNPKLTANNREIGAYIQDDYSPTRRLELNLGLRWDYESNAFNNGYVTPQNVRTLASPFVTDSRYFSNAGDRKPFYGAFQPRLGFSYDLFGNGRTALFGGGGLYYDRNAFNNTLDEKYKLQYTQYTFLFQEFAGDNRPGRIAFQPQYLSAAGLQGLLASGAAGRPQLFLNASDTKLPHSVQSSLGVRQSIGQFQLSVSGSYIKGYNAFSFIPLRNTTTGNLVSGPGFDQILLSSDAATTRYRAMYVKLDRPLIGDAKWGGQLAYTLSKSETNGTDEGQGNFNYDVLNEATLKNRPYHPTQGDERSHLTANLVRVLPAEFKLSGTLSLGSGTPYNVITGCPNTKAFVDQIRSTPVANGGNPTFEQFCVDKGYYGNGNFTAEDDFAPGADRNSGRPPRDPFIFGLWAYRNVDLRLSKQFSVGGRGLEVIGEVFNAFGFNNFRYNERNLRFDQTSAPIDVNSAQRTQYQLGAKVNF